MNEIKRQLPGHIFDVTRINEIVDGINSGIMEFPQTFQGNDLIAGYFFARIQIPASSDFTDNRYYVKRDMPSSVKTIGEALPAGLTSDIRTCRADFIDINGDSINIATNVAETATHDIADGTKVLIIMVQDPSTRPLTKNIFYCYPNYVTDRRRRKGCACSLCLVTPYKYFTVVFTNVLVCGTGNPHPANDIPKLLIQTSGCCAWWSADGSIKLTRTNTGGNKWTIDAIDGTGFFFGTTGAPVVFGSDATCIKDLGTINNTNVIGPCGLGFPPQSGYGGEVTILAGDQT